jgi:hypothetical protein
MPNQYTYVRCPCCGKLSLGRNFNKGHHVFEIRLCSSVGGRGKGRGFFWSERDFLLKDLPFLKILLGLLENAKAKVRSVIAALELSDSEKISVSASSIIKISGENYFIPNSEIKIPGVNYDRISEERIPVRPQIRFNG